jgi:hypothetical protein
MSGIKSMSRLQRSRQREDISSWGVAPGYCIVRRWRTNTRTFAGGVLPLFAVCCLLSAVYCLLKDSAGKDPREAENRREAHDFL